MNRKIIKHNRTSFHVSPVSQTDLLLTIIIITYNHISFLYSISMYFHIFMSIFKLIFINATLYLYLCLCLHLVIVLFQLKYNLLWLALYTHMYFIYFYMPKKLSLGSGTCTIKEWNANHNVIFNLSSLM